MTTAALEEVRSWPGTVSIQKAASALGISRNQLSRLIRSGQSPVRTIEMGSYCRVVTASLARVLDGGEA
ncbi:helix-turn-helix domain-containing protein [Streptomyces sp. NPDC096080]|uniref:helix-turn-helix domain-containing protein n=1 Tax=Streptomyces sp. NPDC096080 TaxID=3156693 RepID=UPI00332A07F7